jgi:hypothetical protein
MSESVPFRRSFLLEATSALAVTLFGLKNIFGAETGLHSIIALYLLFGGAFFLAIVIRRRSGPPQELPENATSLSFAIEKLCASRPFGFICLAITPLPMGFGGFGFVVFLLVYLAGVNAMRFSDEELKTWVFAPSATVSAE